MAQNLPKVNKFSEEVPKVWRILLYLVLAMSPNFIYDRPLLKVLCQLHNILKKLKVKNL